MVFLWTLLFCLRICPTKYFQIFLGEEYLLPWTNQRKDSGSERLVKSSLKGTTVEPVTLNNEKEQLYKVNILGTVLF